MKKTLLLTLAGIMLVIFTQCGASKAYKKAISQIEEYKTVLDNANDCEKLDETMPIIGEKLLILLDQANDKENNSMTEKEKTLLKEAIESFAKTAEEKYERLGCADVGITRRPPVEEKIETKIAERNVMNVMIGSDDVLSVSYGEGEFKVIELTDLSNLVKHFMTPRPNDENAPEVEVKHIDLLGDVPVSKGVVSLKNGRGTSYEMYIKVQNELAKAFKEMRNDLSMKKFGKPYEQLTEEQDKAISQAIPVRISEAEPCSE